MLQPEFPGIPSRFHDLRSLASSLALFGVHVYTLVPEARLGVKWVRDLIRLLLYPFFFILKCQRIKQNG